MKFKCSHKTKLHGMEENKYSTRLQLFVWLEVFGSSGCDATAIPRSWTLDFSKSTYSPDSVGCLRGNFFL
jgi:hypothetical protein